VKPKAGEMIDESEGTSTQTHDQLLKSVGFTSFRAVQDWLNQSSVLHPSK